MVTPISLPDFADEGPIQRAPTVPIQPARSCLTQANGNPKISKARDVPSLQIVF